MTRSFFLKVLFIHLLAKNLAFASVGSWAFQQIETNRAQELTRGRSQTAITVAVIDTGADLRHHALTGALWTNPGEIPDNGIDDDRNGFVDDVHGWNFVRDSADLTDTQGHGTHIAGLIAGNSSSYQGVAPQARLMILKYYDPKLSSLQNLKNEIRAFEYAIRMKARIINFSGGGPGANSLEESVLRLAEKNQILVVAASGNDGADTDRFPYYPANYACKNILSVTATDPLRRMPAFANYGFQSAHIAAPGENINSAAPGGGLTELSGTSQATALTSGAAALLLMSDASLSPSDLIARLQAGSRYETSLRGRTTHSSILNVYRSLAMRGPRAAAVDLNLDLEKTDSPNYIVRLDPVALDRAKTLSDGGPRQELQVSILNP